MPQIELNAPAPDFTLADLHGNNVNLTDFRKTKNVLLVLSRGLA